VIDGPLSKFYVAVNFLEEFLGTVCTIANLDAVEKRLILGRDCGDAGYPTYNKFNMPPR
jgi:hypothetical protein